MHQRSLWPGALVTSALSLTRRNSPGILPSTPSSNPVSRSLLIPKATDSFIGRQVVHSVTVYDPIKVFGPGGALENDGHLTTPHFFIKAGTNPAADEMAATIKAADALVCVTPEYNHSVPPALASLMGHFGGSNFKWKPSSIVTYSPGPWGGMRGAMALRPMLSELGCLPVSKLTAFPDPTSLFNADGTPKDTEARMLKQLPAMLTELEWVAVAFQKMKETAGLPA